ncbi:MAG: HAMP domain-containing protein [Rhodospirillales bacterium]|jgi:two-component system, OmpR family, sensor histidine kinase ChvG|nr:HAMP domain-containing protein [Rhodospirillales bacterium]MBT5076425.1 HAMP domain-containing protein [Rhodospirillales bacterium]MBT5114147.1 HAMP domain-containing protein [Rhodospirillales bacterium]MBT5672675.1 HAMP domain-containing protein [Rhodospirillales bacterium]MBT6185655.1 HAMP domain-containing protein [Rhodospirillales bacterium]
MKGEIPKNDKGIDANSGRRSRFRSITARVLAVNVLALVILVVGLLYLDRYKEHLIQSELLSLETHGGIFAAALGEAAVTTNPAMGQDFLTAMARPMVRRLAVPGGLRAQLFAANGDLIADSRYLGGKKGKVQIKELPPPQSPTGFFGSLLGTAIDRYDWVLHQLSAGPTYLAYPEKPAPKAADYPEAQRALAGETRRSVRARANGQLVLMVALPVQRYKQVLGALVLSIGDERLSADIRGVRIEILTVFLIVLAITVLMSLWLAGTIARPMRQLAAAADRVRHGQDQARSVTIPDFTNRGDEIGDLSGALREMTQALWVRMEAIEGFAADVAHEIKNPLTSLKSAVETASRFEYPEQQKRLMAVILDDVERLDRLITDISDASRLDAELGRARMTKVDIRGILETLVDIERTTRESAAKESAASAPEFILALPGDDDFTVLGMRDRLGQVFANLIANAVSFSPPGGTIRITGNHLDGRICIAIEDQGPGMPPGKFQAVFERFYTERPIGEKFGTHSGLGLSISQQIIDAHRGHIRAENVEREGAVVGARFVISLPEYNRV